MSPSLPEDDLPDFDPTEYRPSPGSGPPLPPPKPPDSGNALPVGTYLGEFELLGVVGEGGFGIVYRAWDHSLKRQVAIKEYMPASLASRTDGVLVGVRSERYAEPFYAGLQSFVKEAQMLAQFDHPALVKVYRFWEANGSAYMVMPFYEGKTLRDELRRRGAAPEEATLLGWIGPVADALAVIHAEHWYHRDIAPDNVLLLAGSQRPLLLDFGAARRVIGDMTQALTVILKPGYAPVEQYAEIPGMKQGPWTDVYALAGVAYYALRGRTPPPSVGRLVNDSYEPLVGSALEGRYDPVVLAALDHALAVRPEHRTKSIAEFKAELGLPPPPAPSHVGEYLAGRAPEPAPADPSAGPDPTLSEAITDLLLPTAAPAERTVQGPPPVRTVYMPPEPRTALPTPAPAERTLWVPPPTAPPTTPPTRPPPAPASTAAESAAKSAGAGKWIGVGVAVALVAGVGGFMALRPRTEAPPFAVPPSPPGSAASNLAPAPPPSRPEQTLSFDVGAEFDRVVALQTPGWGLEVKVDPNRLRINKDKLRFTLRSLQEGYIYVFSYSADGQLLQLYPNELTPPPRIAKGGTLKLPQGTVDFNTDGPAGASRMLVLVSRWPRDHKAFAPRELGGFKTYPTGSEAALLTAASSDKLPLIAGRAICPAGQSCTDEFGAATTTYEVVP